MLKVVDKLKKKKRKRTVDKTLTCNKKTEKKFSESWHQLLLLSHFSRVRLCDRIDSSPPSSSVPGILQARILEWVAISFSNACMYAKSPVVSNSVRPCGRQPTRLLCPPESLGKNIRGGCHFLLQWHQND